MDFHTTTTTGSLEQVHRFSDIFLKNIHNKQRKHQKNLIVPDASQYTEKKQYNT